MGILVLNRTMFKLTGCVHPNESLQNLPLLTDHLLNIYVLVPNLLGLAYDLFCAQKALGGSSN